jgi:dienelactone hydrolase
LPQLNVPAGDPIRIAAISAQGFAFCHDSLPASAAINDPVRLQDGLISAGAPAPIQTVIYPGAYHAWTVPDLTTARFFPGLVSLKKCPLFLIGSKGPALLIDGETKPFDPAAVGACLAAAPGYSMGFDAAVRAQSIADAVSFLQRNLRP